jgi:hypothetical protein
MEVCLDPQSDFLERTIFVMKMEQHGTDYAELCILTKLGCIQFASFLQKNVTTHADPDLVLDPDLQHCS